MDTWDEVDDWGADTATDGETESVAGGDDVPVEAPAATAAM